MAFQIGILAFCAGLSLLLALGRMPRVLWALVLAGLVFSLFIEPRATCGPMARPQAIWTPACGLSWAMNP